MFYAVEIMNDLRKDLAQLRGEFSEVYSRLVQQTFEDHTHHFPITLWAYLMAAFARVDLYSRLWAGHDKPQTPRMNKFLQQYSSGDPLAHALAVKLWRHTLMHTSRPRRLRDPTNGREFCYLLHWGADHLPLAQHYTVTGSDKLVLGVEYFLADLDRMFTAFAADAISDERIQQNVLQAWPEIDVQDFRLSAV